ncbi:hypothetical protein [Ammoniphilus sp. CFH 90114]|uniref:hypothetical protein n=1 Tax=Ammoniphilus sp. CFH 90114 TaxID=2493665 RepID=UPI00100F2E3E|nr:hypothetical protein [Ammoniphilus sp. CFH 90114]RXT07021.1 hypothetical protein EIZ39_12755 [Ammoniphilus sp. CFH 90114]
MVKKRIEDTLHLLEDQKTKWSFSKLGKPMKIAVLAGALITFSGMTYAATNLYQLMNDKGEVVMELTEEPIDSTQDWNSMEELVESIEAEQTIIAYETDKYPTDEFMIHTKPSEYSELGELNAESQQSYDFKEELSGGYTFKKGIIMAEREGDIFQEIKEELLQEAKDTDKKIVYRILDGLVGNKQLNTLAEYTNGHEVVHVLTTDDTARYENMKHDPSQTDLSKVMVNGQEAFYINQGVRQAIQWISETDGTKRYFRVATMSETVKKEDLINLANEIE